MAPFKFVPYLKPVLWGGDKIAPFKGVESDCDNIGESWEISGVPGHESVVSEGPDKGLKLPQLVAKYGEALMGRRVMEKYGATFPLLIKLIDAKKDLSVQVHPDDELARRRHDSLGKTEMWYIVDTEPGARIYAGLSREITPDDYTRLVEEKKIMDVVASHESAPGDIFFLPAGRIHAIGAGNLLAEIQETSDITYRVYDFDRRDANGNPRELHTELAKDAIDYTVYPEYKGSYDKTAKGETDLVECGHFDVRRVIVEGENPVTVELDSFVVIMCLDGQCEIDACGVATPMHRGWTILVPAESAASITARGNAVLLTATAR
ncbi:MAG: class I mannose-6-phosphate isomerase [Muribaculum sp.]|nr:class I mannose-6-phosphate isomerase [Muribaculum sp.]